MVRLFKNLSFKQGLVRPLLLTLLAGLGSICGQPQAPAFDKSRISNILMIALGGIGDVIRLFPAIQTLRLNFPSARLTLLLNCPPDVLALLPGSPVSAEIIRTRTGGGLTGLPDKLALIRLLRRRKFDLIFDPSRGQGFIENDLRCFLIGAPIRIGFYQRGAGFLHTHALAFRQDRYLVEQILDLLTHVGILPYDRTLSIGIAPQARRFAIEFVRRQAAISPARLIVLHPGSNDPCRRWPAARFRELLRRLCRLPSTQVFLIGDAAERSLAQEVVYALDDPRITDCTGQFTLPQTAALISLSDVFIGNDSAPLHLAVALGIPSVAPFGPTSPQQVLPSDQRFVPIAACRFVVERQLPHPCYTHQPLFTHAPCVGCPCIHRITVDQVWSACVSLLTH